MAYQLCRKCGNKGVRKVRDGLKYMGIGKKSVPSYKKICKYCKAHYDISYKGR